MLPERRPVRLWGSLLAVLAALGLLALALDHGSSMGLGSAGLRRVGVAYFALLLAAPLVLYPIGFFAGAAVPTRVMASLLPGFVWWLSELALRASHHSAAEALWLVVSPFNTGHLQMLFLQMMLAELGCRTLARLRGRPIRVLTRPLVLTLAAVLLVVGNPLLSAAWFMPFSHGYHALFQRGLLPVPESFPGPLPPESPGDSGRRRPNFVVILSDDHRFDAAGFAGHPFIRTPGLDRLASEGVVFERAFVTSSLCGPSRASFLTGSWPQRHGVFNNFTPWSDGNRTFLEYLGRAGYRAAFIGKWHMPGKLPELRGVERFVTFTNLGGQGSYWNCPLVVDGREEPSRKAYIAEELTDRAIEFLRDSREAPFVLYLSHKNVHAPFSPDESEDGSLDDAPVSLPPGAHPWSHMTRAQYVHLTPLALDDAIRRYGEAVTSMDRQIGRVLDALDDLGLADRTVVVYASDNGYLWGEHGLMDKRWAYEESIRIPFVVRYPGSGAPVAGTRVDRLVLNVDLAPTLLDAAGLPIPDSMQGRSLLPLLRDPEAPWRDAFYYAYWFEPPYPTPTLRALRTERLKLVEYDDRPDEIFDLVADPGEASNRLDRMAPAEVEALRERLARERARVEAGV